MYADEFKTRLAFLKAKHDIENLGIESRINNQLVDFNRDRINTLIDDNNELNDEISELKNNVKDLALILINLLDVDDLTTKVDVDSDDDVQKWLGVKDEKYIAELLERVMKNVG